MTGWMPEQQTEISSSGKLPFSNSVGLALAGVLCLASLAWGLDLYRRMGLSFMNEQFLSGMLALALPAVFLIFRATRPAVVRPAPYYDWLLSLLCAGAALYVTVRYPNLLDRLYRAPLDASIAGTILIAGIAEGLRRTAGRTLFIFLIFFLLFGFLSHYLPFSIRGEQTSYMRYSVFLGLNSNGVLGFALQVAVTMVVAFLLFGYVLEKAGGATFFTDLSKAIVGQRRGGAAKIAVVASGLFGSISGSAVSNVVSTGVVTIPLMNKSGYSREDAAGIEAVASTGGQLMPPLMGIAAFLIAETLQIPYAAIVVAAIIPALLYYWAVFVQVDLLALKENIRPLKQSDVPSAIGVLKAGSLFFIPFVIIIAGLFTFNLQPETAAIYATLSIVPIGFLVGYRGERLAVGSLLPILVTTGKSSLEILMISAAAGIIIGILNISGLGFALTLELANAVHGNLAVLLIVTAVLSIILGMGMPTVGVYLLLATLLAPSIVEVGVPELAAHLFVFYFGMMSMITPPVAIAAFTAATLAKANPLKTSFAAVRFGWVAYFLPFLIVSSPAYIMSGSWVDIGITFASAVVAIWLISVALVGFLTVRMGHLMRCGFAIAGGMLLIPVDLGSGSILVNCAGLALAAGMLWANRVHTRRVAAVTIEQA